MDDALRALERKLQTEPCQDTAMQYFALLIRMGRKVTFKSFPTPKVGIHVRRHRVFAGDDYWYVVNTNASPRTSCKHRHASKKNAIKCARRHAHRFLLETPLPEIVASYIRIGRPDVAKRS